MEHFGIPSDTRIEGMSFPRQDGKKVFKTFTPIGNLVALDIHRIGETQEGLVLPEGIGDPGNSPTGTVIAVGPDCKYVKEGDIVVGADKTPGCRITHGGSGKVLVVSEEQLIGVSLSSPTYPLRGRVEKE